MRPRTLRRAFERTWPERRLFGVACVSLSMARVALLVLPLACVRRLVTYLVTIGDSIAATGNCTSGQLIWACGAAARHSPVGSTCLATALTAQALLRRHGYHAGLRIGVKRDPDGAFTAHAWLEREGRVIVGGPVSFVQTYQVMPEMEYLIR